MNLFSKVEEVTTEEDFINFILELARDREDEAEKERCNPGSPYGSGVNGWKMGI